MWSNLVNMSRDDCRRTLRRLELEAYSIMMSVFRAQGALEDSRKKLLEELRVVLRIGEDRHSAEARRVANDELLTTIADQLSGPNTELAWLCEGRRKVPLLPRGVPQTMFTELADKFAEKYAAENKEFLKKLAASKPKVIEERMHAGPSMQSFYSHESMEDHSYPIATEDPSIKLWETELINRKRKIPETPAYEDAITPIKNVKNSSANRNQKYLNISQLYSKFSQQIANKPVSQSKHSYNQVGKVPTNKSGKNSTTKSTRGSTKGRSRGAKSSSLTKKQLKKMQQSPSKYNSSMQESPSKYNSTSPNFGYVGPPNTFQASYAQAVLGGKSKAELAMENCEVVGDGEREMQRSKPDHEEPPPPQAAPEPTPQPHVEQPVSATSTTVTGKPYQLVIKKSQLTTNKKLGDIKLIQKPSESGIKVISNRQVLVTSSVAPKTPSSGKYVTTKVIGPVSRTSTPISGDKMIVVSKPMEQKNMITSKLIGTPIRSGSPVMANTSNNTSPKVIETITPKGIPATDLKVSAKTFMLNPKQKMVVFPAKGRTKAGVEGQSMPLIQLKSMSTPMRLVPMGSQVLPPRPSPVLVPQALLSNAKLGITEQIKTANMADIVPVKGLAPVTTTARTVNPQVRTTAAAKSNVIVVQKGSPLTKSMPFTKNGNDMSKIIMGKNISQLMQAKQDTEATKGVSNVILLDLNNDQMTRATTMSEILDSRSSNTNRGDDAKGGVQKITEDTPVLFDAQITEEVCNTSSVDSATGSIGELVTLETIEGEKVQVLEQGKARPSSVTDWEMELDTVVSTKDKHEDKLNSLQLDLGISSDSEGDFMGSRKNKSKISPQECLQRRPSADSKDPYDTTCGIYATRTLLSQLQDDGSSSNDSSFALRAKIRDTETKSESPLTKSESEALKKAKEKLSEKVAKERRIDVFSTAISSTEINLDSFSYLEEGMLADEESPSLETQHVSECSLSK